VVKWGKTFPAAGGHKKKSKSQLSLRLAENTQISLAYLILYSVFEVCVVAFAVEFVIGSQICRLPLSVFSAPDILDAKNGGQCESPRVSAQVPGASFRGN
jgi:hypothetical protein